MNSKTQFLHVIINTLQAVSTSTTYTDGTAVRHSAKPGDYRVTVADDGSGVTYIIRTDLPYIKVDQPVPTWTLRPATWTR